MEIKYYEDSFLDSLNELLGETFDVEKVYQNKSDDIELIMVNRKEVVGYLNLHRCINLITGSKYCYVNYVCVKNSYKRQGIATSLFKKVFELCKNEGISYIELTSNESRIAAHELYEKLGFTVRDTTVFRKVIQDDIGYYK